MLTGTLEEIATFLESETTSFVESLCFYFCLFVLQYSFKSGESLFNNYYFFLFNFNPQFQTTFVSDLKWVS